MPRKARPKGTPAPSSVYVPRVRDKNEAMPQTCAWANQDRDYVTGDGDVHQHIRPGAMHAYSLPSRGLSV